MTLGTKPPITPDTPKPEDDLLQQRITELDQQAKQADQLAAKYTSQPPPGQDITQWLTEQKSVLPEVGKEATSARAKAQFLRNYQEEKKRIETIEKRAESPGWEVDQEALTQAKDNLTQMEETVSAITSKELAPYIEVKKGGNYTVKVDAARKAGVSSEKLATVGISQSDIDAADRRIRKGEPAPVSAEKAAKIRAAGQFVSQQALARFKRTHKQMPDEQWVDALTLKTLEKESPEVYKRLTKEGFDAANEYIQWENEKFDKAADTLEDYPYMITTYDKSGKAKERPSKGGQIDTIAAVKAGKEEEVALIFGPEAVVEAQEYIKAEKEYQDWLDKQPKNAAEAIWRALTPWNEEKGETFGGYIVNTPNRLFHPGMPSQEELKETYEAEHSSPLWARVAFGGDTVIKTKDAKGNEIYTQLAFGYGPPIAPAGTSTIPVNFNKIVNQVRQARLNQSWKTIVAAIRRGNINDTASSVRWMRTNTSVNIRPTPQSTGYLSQTAAERMAQKISTFEDMEWFNSINQASQAARAQQFASELEAFKVIGIPYPGKITLTQVESAVERLNKLKPTVAIRQLTKAMLIPAAFIAEPQTMVQILTEVSPQIREQVQVQLKNLAQQVTQTNVLTQTQTEQLVNTLTQIQNAVQTRTQLQLQTKTQQATATKTQLLKPSRPVTRQPSPTQRPGIQQTTTFGAPTKLKPSIASEKEKRRIIRNAEVVLGWRQGELHGKHRWDILVDPFTPREQYLVVIGSKPRGMGPPLRGPRSAYNTAQTATGHLGKAGIIDLPGIMSAKLWPLEGKKKIGIKFQRDIDISKGKKVFPLGRS